MKLNITHIGWRFVHNGGAEIFLRDLSRCMQDDVVFKQSICTGEYEKQFCDTFPHPIVVGGEKEISQAIRDGDAIICWGGVNLNLMMLPKPKICIFNACAEVKDQLMGSIKYVNHIIACSTKTAKAVCCKGIKHTTILPGIETKRLHITEERFAKREQLGIKKDEFLVGMIARIDHQKRQSWLVEVMKQLKIPKIKAIFVGDGPLMDSLKRDAPSNCMFVGHQTDIGNWWNILDCYCLLSTQEGCPASLFESMFFKIPIISTFVGSAQDLLTHENSILIGNSTSNIKELIIAIERMSTMSKKDIEKITNLTYQRFEEHGHINKTATSWSNLLWRLNGEKCKKLFL